MLISRMTEAERDAIVSPATSLLIFQTDIDAGFNYYDGTIWQRISKGVGIYAEDGTTSSGIDVSVIDQINFDANTLFVDGTNDKVGIVGRTKG